MANAIIKPISKEEVAKAQIEGNLPDKPSQATLYGGKVLTPQEIKAWYDKLPKLIVDYYNNLIKAIPGIEDGKISDNSLAAQILTGIREGHSMKNLLEDITSGALADYLKVTEDVNLTSFYEKVLARITTFGTEAPSEEAELGNLYAEIRDYGIRALYMYVEENGVKAWKKLWSGPKIRINETTHEWEVSYDNGESWQSLDTQAEPRSVYLSCEAGQSVSQYAYKIENVSITEGMSLKVGDIVLFLANSTISRVVSIYGDRNQYFSCAPCVSIKGATGASGYSIHYANVTTELTTTIIADTAFTNNTYNPIKAGDVCVSANGMIFVIGERYSSVGWNVTAKSSIGYSVHYSTYEATSATTEIPQSSISGALNPSIKTNDICITPNGLMFRIGTKKDAFTWNVTYLSSIKGNPFRVTKTFASVEEMEADTSIPEGSFVVISTGNVEDEENARLYVRTLTGYGFITDMSGAKGIQGPQGIQGIQGIQGPQGEKGVGVPTVTKADDGKFLRVRGGVVVAEDASDIAQHGVTLTNHEKRITNLEKGLPADRFVTDDEIAYVKTVPSNALPYAAVSKIGGMSKISTNLFGGDAFRHKIIEVGGVNNNDGTVTLQGYGGLVNQIIFDQFKKNTQYTFFFKVSLTEAGLATLRIVYTDGNYTNINVTTPDSPTVVTMVSEASKNVKAIMGTWQTDTTYYYNECGVFEGVIDEKDFEPYYNGIRSNRTTSIEITGANIFGGEALADKIVEFGGTSNSDGTATLAGAYYGNSITGKIAFDKFKANTQYTFIFKVSISALGSTGTADITLRIVYTDGTGTYFTLSEANKPVIVKVVSDEGKTIQGLVGTWQTETIFYYNECGVFEGVKEAKDFKSYWQNNLPIPEAAQVENGINADFYDSIEWTEDGARVKHKRVEKIVFDGTEAWVIGANNRFELSDRISAMPYTNTPCISNSYDYNTTVYSDGATDNGILAHRNMLYVRDKSYSSAASWKAHLAELYSAGTPLTLVYALAEPIVTDISDILTADNLLTVEGGGTITFVNENGSAVPSSITYQVKEG